MNTNISYQDEFPPGTIVFVDLGVGSRTAQIHPPLSPEELEARQLKPVDIVRARVVGPGFGTFFPTLRVEIIEDPRPHHSRVGLTQAVHPSRFALCREA